MKPVNQTGKEENIRRKIYDWIRIHPKYCTRPDVNVTFDTFENQLRSLQTPRYGHLLMREDEHGTDQSKTKRLNGCCTD